MQIQCILCKYDRQCTILQYCLFTVLLVVIWKYCAFSVIYCCITMSLNKCPLLQNFLYALCISVQVRCSDMWGIAGKGKFIHNVYQPPKRKEKSVTIQELVPIFICCNIYVSGVYFTCSHDHTCPLALLFCVKAVPVPVTASIPELCAGVGLPVIVPSDVIVPTRALIQEQLTTGVQRHNLWT